MTKQSTTLELAERDEQMAGILRLQPAFAPELRRLHALNAELLEALKSVHAWMADQADGQSKGGHATFDLMMLREQRDIADAAIAKGEA